ncbi:MAG: spore coat associated protein CotJA [Lachnospiraceae bacterium]|nr:spore coat associated protein CotJA [Lachnospiraceae bacterium]MBU5469111.1 spore coat associated protein CotJA [Falcatimonas sp. MSJ-15]
MVLAMAYVLPQCFKGINDSFDSFKNGSIFPELIKPFTGKGGCR